MSNREKIVVLEKDMEIQKNYIKQIKEYIGKSKKIPTACVQTFGCAQNENDSEKLKGMLLSMGYELGNEPENLILFCTIPVQCEPERKTGCLEILEH